MMQNMRAMITSCWLTNHNEAHKQRSFITGNGLKLQLRQKKANDNCAEIKGYKSMCSTQFVVLVSRNTIEAEDLLCFNHWWQQLQKSYPNWESAASDFVNHRNVCIILCRHLIEFCVSRSFLESILWIIKKHLIMKNFIFIFSHICMLFGIYYLIKYNLELLALFILVCVQLVPKRLLSESRLTGAINKYGVGIW